METHATRFSNVVIYASSRQGLLESRSQRIIRTSKQAPLFAFLVILCGRSLALWRSWVTLPTRHIRVNFLQDSSLFRHSWRNRVEFKNSPGRARQQQQHQKRPLLPRRRSLFHFISFPYDHREGHRIPKLPKSNRLLLRLRPSRLAMRCDDGKIILRM